MGHPGWRDGLCCLVGRAGDSFPAVWFHYPVFFLYTWPFFLALLPVSVLVGIAATMLLQEHFVWAALATVLLVIGLFWLLFTLLTGW